MGGSACASSRNLQRLGSNYHSLSCTGMSVRLQLHVSQPCQRAALICVDNKNDQTHQLIRVVTPLVTECFQRFPWGLVFPGKPLRKPKSEFKNRLNCQTENMFLLELFAFLCFVSCSLENLYCTHGCFCAQSYARCPDLESAKNYLLQ